MSSSECCAYFGYSVDETGGGGAAPAIAAPTTSAWETPTTTVGPADETPEVLTAFDLVLVFSKLNEGAGREEVLEDLSKFLLKSPSSGLSSGLLRAYLIVALYISRT